MLLEKETFLVTRFPDNPVARDSMTSYITAVKSVYAGVANPAGRTLYGSTMGK